MRKYFLLSALALVTAGFALIGSNTKDSFAISSNGWTTQVLTQDFNQEVITAFNSLPPIQTRSTMPEGLEDSGVWDLCRDSTGCDIWTPGRHVSAVLGPWDFGGGCVPTEKKGCVMLLVNVGNTATLWNKAQTGPGMYFVSEYSDGTPSALANETVDLASYMASITLMQGTDKAPEGHPWMNTCSAVCEEVSIVIYTNDPRFNLVSYTTVRR